MFDPAMVMTYPLSQGHAGDPENLHVSRPQVDSAVYRPSGFGYSTVLDLAQFAIAFLNDGKIDGKQIIPRAVIAKISAPYVPIHSSPQSNSIVDGKYGYGLISHNFRGVRVVEHGGRIPGYGCRLVTVPEHRFAVIVMTNQTGVTLNRSIEKAMELMLPLKAKEEDRSKDWAKISEAEMSRYVGVYQNNQSRLEIVMKGGKLMFVVSGNELPMTRIGEHRFSVPRRNANELTFVMGADGKAEYRHTGLRAWKRIEEKK
jgi:CubicO group peptidase (beta-lactamase class C family)